MQGGQDELGQTCPIWGTPCFQEGWRYSGGTSISGWLGLCISQHSLGQCGDLEERVMVDKDTGLWVHFRKEQFLFFPTAIYILSSYLLETSLQVELEQAISLTPHLSSSFHSFLPLWPCSPPEDIPARLHLMSAVS